jgi:polysaccharide export outer membrane protein
MRCFLCFIGFLALLAPRLHAQAIATLRPGDVFEVRLSGMPQEYASEFSLQYTVGQDGTINVPLIGEVKAVGLTSTQLERSIQTRLVAEKIFTQPTVIINIASVARYVSVSGGVRAPQRLQWTTDLTLSSAIGNCQGISDFGSDKGIQIIRGSKIAGTYNLKEIRKDPAKDPQLLPGDQVLVRE